MDVRLIPRFSPLAPPLLLSPHFDDAIFSCWSLLSNSQPLYSAIVFAAAPEAGWRDSNHTSKEETDLTLDRINDTKFAYSLAGRQPAFLPFASARYRKEDPEHNSILGAICHLAPEVSAIYAPAGITDHPDHLLLRRLALKIYALGIPVFLYAEMPSACRKGWPALVVPPKGEENTKEIINDWRLRLREVKAIDIFAPIVTALPFRESVTKQRLAKAFKDQISGEGPLNPERAVNILLDPGVSRYEVCWSLGLPKG
jgi:hypothetical protein